MDYTLDEFDALKERIEAMGGRLLDALCEGKQHKFPDMALANLKDAQGQRGPRPQHLFAQSGCGDHSLFEIPYRVQDPDVQTRRPMVLGKITLCAHCDNLGERPRFKEA